MLAWFSCCKDLKLVGVVILAITWYSGSQNQCHSSLATLRKIWSRVSDSHRGVGISPSGLQIPRNRLLCEPGKLKMNEIRTHKDQRTIRSVLPLNDHLLWYVPFCAKCGNVLDSNQWPSFWEWRSVFRPLPESQHELTFPIGMGTRNRTSLYGFGDRGTATIPFP